MEGKNDLVYGACLKNYAAAHGHYILDGCGQFAPDALGSRNCAACGCHKNFHIDIYASNYIELEAINDINGGTIVIAQPCNSEESVITQLTEEVEENDPDLDDEVSSEIAPESDVSEKKN